MLCVRSSLGVEKPLEGHRFTLRTGALCPLPFSPTSFLPLPIHGAFGEPADDPGSHRPNLALQAHAALLTTIYRALTHTLPISRALSHPPATNTPDAQAPLHHLHHLPSKSVPASTAYLPLNSHACPNSPTHTLANHLLTSNHPCTPSPISSHSLFVSSSPSLIPRRHRLLIHCSSFPTSLVYPLLPSPPHHQAQGVTHPLPHLLHSFPPLPIIRSPLLHPQV